MNSRCLQLVLSVLFILTSGCAQKVAPTGNPGKTSHQASPKTPEVQWVDPKTIQSGPIRHETLTPEQMNRIRKLQAVFFEVDGQTVEQWADGFKRDADPDRELAIWERMATAYTAYCAKRDLTPDAKQEVFRIVLLRSMAPEKEALEHLELKVLSKDEAVEVMRGFQ